MIGSTSRSPNSVAGPRRFWYRAFFLLLTLCPHPAHAGAVYIQPIVDPSPMIKKGHLESGINGDAAPRKDGKTPLMLAVEANQIDVIDYLLEHGADPSLKDAAGDTALDIARRATTGDFAGKLATYTTQHPPPSAYYATRTPQLYIVSGQNQTGSPDCGAPKSLIVYAMGQDGLPLADAPVLFSADGTAAKLVTQASSPDSLTLLLRTDPYGICRANLHLPKTPNTQVRVTATAGIGGRTSKVTFNAVTNDGTSGGSVSSFNPTDQHAIMNGDGTVTVTWQNQTDDETCIRIWLVTPHGMKAVQSVPPHSTSVRIPLE